MVNAAFVKYLAALLLFGMNGIIASFIALSSYEIVFLRALIGGLLLLAVFLILRNKFTFYRNKRNLIFLILSGSAMGASWMFLYEGYQQTGVAVSSLLYYCGPVIVMLLSPLLFREKFTVPRVAGFIIVAGGCLLLNIQGFMEGTAGFGLLCGALSAVMYAAMVICNKKTSGVSGLENPLMQLFFGFVTVGVFVAFKSGFGFLLNIQPGDWVFILILGLINTGLGCYLYFSSLGGLPVQTVSIIGYLEPLAAVVFSAVFLQEILSPLQVAGAVCIIGGALFAEIRWRRRKSGQ